MSVGDLGPGRCVALQRSAGLGLLGRPGVLCVDTADCAPKSMVRFAPMNPFHVDPAWRIGVTGSDRTAHSVESVWQGSKLVDGQTDEGMFGRIPSKRPPEDERTGSYRYEDSIFLVGGREIGLVEARFVLYLPAYAQVLRQLLPGSVLEEIYGALEDERAVAFYDWDDNFDITNPTSAFSHSALLVEHFQGTLDGLIDQALSVADRLGLDLRIAHAGSRG